VAHAIAVTLSEINRGLLRLPRRTHAERAAVASAAFVAAAECVFELIAVSVAGAAAPLVVFF
jgi:hypothetical protein